MQAKGVATNVALPRFNCTAETQDVQTIQRGMQAAEPCNAAKDATHGSRLLLTGGPRA